MNVLHIMQCTELGGMEQAAYGLMDRMLKGGRIGFKVVTPQQFGLGRARLAPLDPDAADCEYRGRFGWRSQRRFRRLVSARATDCSAIWVTGASVASLTAVMRSPLPKILSHHHHHFEGRGSWWRWRAFYELFGHRLDAVVFPTAFTRDEAVSIAPWLKSRTHVIRNGVTLQETLPSDRLAARRLLDLPERALIIGNGGWLIARKRFDIFLQVAARVKAVLPEAVFVICGDGPLRPELEEMATALGLADCVRFEGWTSDMTPYYKAFDIALFNSDHDAFGRTPLEAASHGAIVVASVLHGGLSEFIQHERNGFLWPRHEVGKMAEAIIRVGSGDGAERIRQSAFASIRRDYDIARAAAEYAELFSTLTGQTRSMAPAGAMPFGERHDRYQSPRTAHRVGLTNTFGRPVSLFAMAARIARRRMVITSIRRRRSGFDARLPGESGR